MLSAPAEGGKCISALQQCGKTLKVQHNRLMVSALLLPTGQGQISLAHLLQMMVIYAMPVLLGVSPLWTELSHGHPVSQLHLPN